MAVKIRRAYEQPHPGEGVRILVDRFWPRGVSKEELGIFEWMKEISPDPKLIKWFGHKPERWEEFRRKYKEELAGKEELVQKLRDLSKRGKVTLIYSAKDEKHNNAVVLKEVIEG